MSDENILRYTDLAGSNPDGQGPGMDHSKNRERNVFWSFLCRCVEAGTQGRTTTGHLGFGLYEAAQE